MSTYVAAYKGYIADVPQVWFKRCDGKIFHYDEITQASANPQTNYTEVNAGWSLYPVAYLPGQSTFELSMTSGQFNADLFAMANNRDFNVDSTYQTYTTETLTIDPTTHKVTLTETPVADSIYIAGLEKATTAAAGKYAVSGKEITFNEDETGEIEVSYETTLADAQVVQLNNQTSAIGEAVFKWPIYGSGDDCTENAIKGYVIMKVYRCRVTQMPKHNWALCA